MRELPSKILHLTLKKKWFDMIASGEKKEEYREVKTYWIKRLVHYGGGFEYFDIIRFRNGYARNAPTMDVVSKGIERREGRPEWGAEPGVEYFVLKLGEVLSTTRKPVEGTEPTNK